MEKSTRRKRREWRGDRSGRGDKRMEKMERKNRKWPRDRGRKRRGMREEGEWRGETDVRVSRERMRG